MHQEPPGPILQPPGLRDAPFKAPGEAKHEILVQHEPTYQDEHLLFRAAKLHPD